MTDIKYPIYFKVCPRGFANEVRYIACFDAEEKLIIEREYEDYADNDPNHNASCGWSNDRAAMIPGVAVPFKNRNW